MAALPRRFLRNALSNYAASGVSILLALVLTPVLVRGLGQAGYGVWGLTGSLVQYLSLLRFGFDGAAVRHVAGDDQRGDREHMQAVIATTAWTMMVPAVLVLLASPGIALLFPIIFHVDHRLETPAIIVAGLTVVDFAFSLVTDVFGATLQGLQRYDRLNLSVAGTSLAQATAWVVIIVLGGGLIPLGVALLGFGLVGQLSRYLFVRGQLRVDLLSRRHVQRGLVRSLLTASSWMAVIDLTQLIINELDAVVVGIVVGVPAAAVYLVGQKLSSLVSSFASPVQAMFYSHAATLAAVEDRDGLRESMYSGTRVALAVAVPLMLVLDVLARPALHAWVGSGYGSAALVIVFLSAAFVVDAFARTPVYVLRGMGDVRRPALLGLIEVALNLTLSVVLALALGLKGVALATLIAITVMNFGFTLPYACRRLGVPLIGLVLTAVRAHLPPAAVSLVVGLAIMHLGVGGLLQVIGAGAAMVVTYGLVLWASGLSSQERDEIRRLLRQRRTGDAL